MLVKIVLICFAVEAAVVLDQSEEMTDGVTRYSWSLFKH